MTPAIQEISRFAMERDERPSLDREERRQLPIVDNISESNATWTGSHMHMIGGSPDRDDSYYFVDAIFLVSVFVTVTVGKV